MARDLGPRLRSARERGGLSLHRLAGELFDPTQEKNYDASFLGRVERGEKHPPLRMLVGYGLLLDLTEEEVPEYHLALLRRALDESEVGLEGALRFLKDLPSDARLDAQASASRDFAHLRSRSRT